MPIINQNPAYPPALPNFRNLGFVAHPVIVAA
jgi:hypothetical protein